MRSPTRRAARLMGVTTFLRGALAEGRLHSCLGTLAVCDAGTADGQATYAIRPEHMRLGCGPGPNALPARILAQTFRGEQHEYQLQVGEEVVGTASVWTRRRSTEARASPLTLHPSPLTPQCCQE